MEDNGEEINYEDLSEGDDNNFDISDIEDGSDYVTESEDSNEDVAKEIIEKFDDSVESVKEVLRTELVEAKFNKEFTSEVVLNNLSNSFIVLSNLLEDSKLARENMDQLFTALDKIKEIVEAMKVSADKMNDISQIVEQLNSLAVVISVNSTNMEKLIKIISEQVTKNREFEKDLNQLKSNNFYGGESDGGGSSRSLLDKVGPFIQIMTLALLGILITKGS